MKRLLYICTVISLLLLAMVLISRDFRFKTGAAFINIGYFFQDGVHLASHDKINASELLNEIIERNQLSSYVRDLFPRKSHHPLVAIVACMDSRLHTDELVGDSRGYYYVVRTAGSIIEAPEIEMLELAVKNGIKLILFTTHSDCAAEKAAKDLKMQTDLPNLTNAVKNREQHFIEFLNRPTIASKISSGELLVRKLEIDTLGGGELN